MSFSSPTYTKNYNLRKFAEQANPGANQLNQNWEDIDAAIKSVSDSIPSTVNLARTDSANIFNAANAFEQNVNIAGELGLGINDDSGTKGIITLADGEGNSVTIDSDKVNEWNNNSGSAKLNEPNIFTSETQLEQPLTVGMKHGSGVSGRIDLTNVRTTGYATSTVLPSGVQYPNDVVIELPNKSGVLALESDISSSALARTDIPNIFNAANAFQQNVNIAGELGLGVNDGGGTRGVITLADGEGGSVTIDSDAWKSLVKPDYPNIFTAENQIEQPLTLGMSHDTGVSGELRINNCRDEGYTTTRIVPSQGQFPINNIIELPNGNGTLAVLTDITDTLRTTSGSMKVLYAVSASYVSSSVQAKVNGLVSTNTIAVSGSTNSYITLSRKNTMSNAELWFYDGGTLNCLVGFRGDANFKISPQNAPNALVVNSTTGNVGIGNPTLNSVDKLQVNGNVSTSGVVKGTEMQIANSLFITGSAYTNSPLEVNSSGFKNATFYTHTTDGVWLGSNGTFSGGEYGIYENAGDTPILVWTPEDQTIHLGDKVSSDNGWPLMVSGPDANCAYFKNTVSNGGYIASSGQWSEDEFGLYDAGSGVPMTVYTPEDNKIHMGFAMVVDADNGDITSFGKGNFNDMVTCHGLVVSGSATVNSNIVASVNSGYVGANARAYGSDGLSGGYASVHASRGTPTSRVAAHAGDSFGSYVFQGDNGTSDFRQCARIDALATQDWNSGAHGTKMQLHVTQNNTTYKTPALTLDQDLSATVEGNIISKKNIIASGSLTVNGASNTQNIIPQSTDAYDLGSSLKLWRKVWASELDSVIFAKNTVQVQGGWQLLVKECGTLTSDVNGWDTFIDLGIPDLPFDAVLLFRTSMGSEYMVITGQQDTTQYEVARDMAGTGAKFFPAGTPFAVLGLEGDGRIELRAGGDDTRISVIEQGASYNSGDEKVRIGDLTGLRWNGQDLTGYGLFTSYGYFSGTVNANSGSIGGVIIDNNKLVGGIISGSVIQGTNISGSFINGSTIKGTTISGSIVTGTTVQTATSGKRVLLSTDGQISFYDGSGHCGSIEAASGHLTFPGVSQIDLTPSSTELAVVNIGLTSDGTIGYGISGATSITQTKISSVSGSFSGPVKGTNIVHYIYNSAVQATGNPTDTPTELEWSEYNTVETIKIRTFYVHKTGNKYVTLNCQLCNDWGYNEYPCAILRVNTSLTGSIESNGANGWDTPQEGTTSVDVSSLVDGKQYEVTVGIMGRFAEDTEHMRRAVIYVESVN